MGMLWVFFFTGNIRVFHGEKNIVYCRCSRQKPIPMSFSQEKPMFLGNLLIHLAILAKKNRKKVRHFTICLAAVSSSSWVETSDLSKSLPPFKAAKFCHVMSCLGKNMEKIWKMFGNIAKSEKHFFGGSLGGTIWSCKKREVELDEMAMENGIKWAWLTDENISTSTWSSQGWFWAAVPSTFPDAWDEPRSLAVNPLKPQWRVVVDLVLVLDLPMFDLYPHQSRYSKMESQIVCLWQINANHDISQIRQHPFLLIESINAVCLATNYHKLSRFGCVWT